MRRSFKTSFFCILATSYLLLATLVPQAHAISAQGSVNTQATVGQFTLSISGYIAPFATVVLSTDTVVLGSTITDTNGNFSFSGILIKAGFSHFCLDAVDVKKLGASEACLSFPPATGNMSMNNIFLPPTLGLPKTQIPVGTTAIAWGYSMPGAAVTLHISDGRTLTTIADASGFYQFNPQFNTTGDFQLFADATLKGKSSLEPNKKLTLTILSLQEQVANQIQKGGRNLSNLLKILGPLLLAIPILILIIILLKKLWPSLFPFIPTIPAGALPAFFDLFKKHEKKLHHWWMKGVGF